MLGGCSAKRRGFLLVCKRTRLVDTLSGLLSYTWYTCLRMLTSVVYITILVAQVISANSFKPIEPVSSFDKFRLMRRLRKIGGILMTLHNVLMMEAPYDLLEKLFRKCCVR